MPPTTPSAAARPHVFRGALLHATARLILLAIPLLVALGEHQCEAATPEPSAPNIIYIMVDDLGYGDLGCYGQRQIQTPHLDRLADEGMKLTSYYAGNTVCRPSRLVLWTGLHAGHAPVSSNAPYTMEDSLVTVPELLRKAGYATGGVGKWAQGTPGSGGEPIHHGFDFWMGYLDQGMAHNYYPTHLWRCAAGQCAKFPMPGNVLMDHPHARGRVAKPEHRKTYSHNVMTDQAFAFLRDVHDKPFLMHIHWTIPHTNNEGGRVTGDGQEVPDYGIYKDKPWPNVEKGFAAMVTLMDADVGRLVELLGELGVDRKTLIIFTSDNGPHNEGGHDHTFFDSNGPLRGFKRDLYEGGIRVPTIAWWPGVVPAGTTSDEPLAFQDFMPTACALAGVEPPQDIDGISFVPTLRGRPDAQPSHDYLYFQFGNRSSAVRQGPWKLVCLKPYRSRKLTTFELYNLDDDIGEQNNIADKHPDRVERMKAMMQEAGG